MRGWFQKAVIRAYLAIITANAVASAFICTVVAMQGDALETLCMVMDDPRTFPALRVSLRSTSRARKGDVWRWMPIVCVPAQTTPTPWAQKGSVHQERRWFACCPVGTADIITSNVKWRGETWQCKPIGRSPQLRSLPARVSTSQCVLSPTKCCSVVPTFGMLFPLRCPRDGIHGRGDT